MSAGILTDRLRETLALFDEGGGPLTTTEVADSLDVGRRSTYERLETLVEHDSLETKKVGANARVWWQPPSQPGANTPERPAAVDSVLGDVAVGVFVLDEDFDVAWINEATERYFGLDRDEVLGRDKRALVAERIAPAVADSEAFTDTVLATYDDNTETERFECQVTAADEREARWLEHQSKPIEAGAYAGGRVELYYDITDRKRSERKRRKEHREFESLVDTVGKDDKQRREDLGTEVEEFFTRIDDAFYALDEEMRFEYVNDRAEELLGRSEGELLGEPVWRAFSIAEDDPIREHFEKARLTQEPTTFERFSESLETWEIVRVYPSETGLSVSFTDITGRIEHERELEESRNRYQTLVESVPNGAVALVDEDLRYTTVGGTPLVDGSVTMEDLVGQPVTEVLPDDLADRLAPHYRAALDGEVSSFERTTDGVTHVFHTVPVRDDNGDVFAAMGMSQDITERRIREQQLRDRVRQQEVVTDLGQRALENRDLDGLLADAAELVAETLDNDYCKVLDLDPGAGELSLRQGVGWHDGVVGEATVSATECDSQAAYTLATEEPVVVEDLASESRFSGPDLLRDHDVRGGISTIIGSPEDPWGILGTHDTDPKEFSENDATFVQAVANVLASAIERHSFEQELIQQREQIAALNSLNEVVRDITAAVIEQSTREEIEQTVCERLAGTDSYLFAWTGEVEPSSQNVTLRAEAGVEGYLDGITISVDPDDARSDGPTGRALRTGEMQVSHDIRTDSRHDPWRDTIERYGFRSSAAIPITHGGTIYGVLNVYADRPYAFEGRERAVVSQLGEVVGHAIAAAGRKQALLSDELVEIDFEIRDLFAAVDVPVETSGTITFDHVVPVGGREFLVYGTASEDALETVRGLVEAVSHWESVSVISEDDPVSFELRLIDPPVLPVVASHGGYIDQASIEDGHYRMTIHLAPTVDVRNIIEPVEEAYPQAELLRHHQIRQPHDGSQRVQRRLASDLTDRQSCVLEAAYHAGFFEWPRETTGEQIAESLGIAPPTFHQHLRKAQQKTFDVLL